MCSWCCLCNTPPTPASVANADREPGGGPGGGSGCPDGTVGCTRVDTEDAPPCPPRLLEDAPPWGSASHAFFASASVTAWVNASGDSPLKASTSAPPASFGPTMPLRSAIRVRLVRDPNIFRGTGAASMTRERCTLQLRPSVPGALAWSSHISLCEVTIATPATYLSASLPGSPPRMFPARLSPNSASTRSSMRSSSSSGASTGRPLGVSATPSTRSDIGRVC